ncbi:MAG: hypothetical protein WCK28_19765, partial [Burkholderiales bacterium]
MSSRLPDRAGALARILLARGRAGLSVLADGLGPLGIGGVAAIAAGIWALSSAANADVEALALESQAAALHAAAR